MEFILEAGSLPNVLSAQSKNNQLINEEEEEPLCNLASVVESH